MNLRTLEPSGLERWRGAAPSQKGRLETLGQTLKLVVNHSAPIPSPLLLPTCDWLPFYWRFYLGSAREDSG